MIFKPPARKYIKILIGIDMGNKNLKVYSGKGEPHEIPIAYREHDEYWYNNEPIGANIEKVKYRNRYYLVGVQGRSGLPQNKGDINVREISNMFKLVGLAREMRKRNIMILISYRVILSERVAC